MKQKKENKEWKLVKLKAGKLLTEEMNDIKIQFFEKYEIDKPLARLTKREDPDYQYQDEMGYSCSSYSYKRIIKNYCQQLYAHKFDDLEELEQFSESTKCQNSKMKIEPEQFYNHFFKVNL